MTRHRWAEPQRFPYKTERACVRPCCNIVRVTRHEGPEIPWVEFYCDGEPMDCGSKTPPCKGEIEARAA